MKKIVPFVKDLNGKSNIGEITSIALDHTLKLNGQFVSGEFIISGTYKMTSQSETEENFDYKIPVDITIDAKYDTKNCTISIDDFTYEIINEEILRVNISVILDDLDIKIDEIETIEVESIDRNDFDSNEDNRHESKKEVNEISDNLNNKSINDSKFIDNSVNNISVNIDTPNNENKDESNDLEIDLFNNLNDEKEYSIYSVYTVGENDTVELILDKFNITREILADYNDLDNLTVGSKIIIPSVDE
ncbi:MAG: LysM peptidoglycan-binding domain-containing protein [Bacilli bacterium]|nr:LysM peptidoglycan-binding domain-containing protein [Bacilli bacterium]